MGVHFFAWEALYISQDVGRCDHIEGEEGAGPEIWRWSDGAIDGDAVMCARLFETSAGHCQ